MNKAVIGIFPDGSSASRAINDLKAYGFDGSTMAHYVRDKLSAGEVLPGPRLMPARGLLKGLLIGLGAGAIMGAIADWFLGMALTWPTYGFNGTLAAAALTFAVLGGVVGVLDAASAAASIIPARRALSRRQDGDAVVSVATDDTHASKAIELLRAAGAVDIRRGAASVADEYQTREDVQAETYSTATPVHRDVSVPANEPQTTSPTSVGPQLEPVVAHDPAVS